VLFGYSLGNGPLDLGFGDSSGALAVFECGRWNGCGDGYGCFLDDRHFHLRRQGA